AYAPVKLTDLDRVDPEQRSELAQCAADVSDPRGAMMCRAFAVPFLDERARADREPVAAVRVADFENGPRHGLALRHQQLQRSTRGLDDGKQRYRSVLHRHLNG